jgi:tetratricopeptide (TPR) repeat protein
MTEDTISTTQPNKPVEPEKPTRPEKVKRGKWIWLGIGIFLGAAILSSLFGYGSGIQQRLNLAATARVANAAQYFQYGMEQMAAGNYQIARTQFQYVLQLDPSYPGIVDALAQVELQITLAQTPTVMPTPTPSPTPDTRGVEELYNAAVTDMANQDWAGALAALEALRNEDHTYRTVDVDGLYYVVLRERGMQMILSECDPEGGGYFITLAERFAPLDSEAINYRSWARRFMTGVTFWGIDWQRVVDNLADVAYALPNLCDASGYSAVQRYKLALIGYGDTLMRTADPCGANTQYLNASALGIYVYGDNLVEGDDTLQSKIDESSTQCTNLTAPTAPPAGTTPTVTEETPTPTETTTTP